MEKIIRKGIAFEPKELKSFDRLIKAKGYKNRSEAIRDIIRNFLVNQKSVYENNELFATLTMAYDHHHGDVQKKLTDIQHEHHGIVRSSLHIHIDAHNCLEVLVLKGKPSVMQQLSDELLALKGVKHGKLVFIEP